ncbi:MAG: hypothetical protein GY910_24665 [bacterium]|nr:hypothetical protein [Deltaproteobacteria bacterium]MCP4908178.1 hypothetical protein [bacterium]
MSLRLQAGRATGSILLLLVLLSGAGVWNYHRNLQIEKLSGERRPYESYAVADVEALRAAYASELYGVRARFDAAKRKRIRPKRDVGSFSDNVAQFQRTAQTSAAIRDAAAGVADRQDQIAELERELDLRERFGVGLMRHVKRLTTI